MGNCQSKKSYTLSLQRTVMASFFSAARERNCCKYIQLSARNCITIYARVRSFFHPEIVFAFYLSIRAWTRNVLKLSSLDNTAESQNNRSVIISTIYNRRKVYILAALGVSSLNKVNAPDARLYECYCRPLFRKVILCSSI